MPKEIVPFFHHHTEMSTQNPKQRRNTHTYSDFLGPSEMQTHRAISGSPHHSPAENIYILPSF